MNAGKKLVAFSAIVVGMLWGTVYAQQRIREGDAGNPCKIAQVVGLDSTEPYDDVVVTYEQVLTEITSARGVTWVVGAIGKASAGQSLGPDGCRGTADDSPTQDFRVFNTRRDVRCPTASNISLTPIRTGGLLPGWFYAAVSHGDRASDSPLFCCDSTEIIGYRIGLSLTADPNTVSVTRVLLGTDKAFDDDFNNFNVSMVPGQIANDGVVAGRADDFPNGGNPNNADAIWTLDIEGTITSGLPEQFKVTTYDLKPPAVLKSLGGVIGSPMLDAYDSNYVMGTTFSDSVEWTPDSGTTQNSSNLLPAGATSLRGTPGFNSDATPSAGSRGTGALHGKTVAGGGPTDGIVIFEMDNTGVIAATHRILQYPASLTPCDSVTPLSGFEGAHYHGSGFFSGPWGHLAVNAQGHVVAPVDFFPNVGNDDGNNQALIWTNGAAAGTQWGIVAYHGQEWDPANLAGWTLGRPADINGFGPPFSNPTLDDYNNVFFTCEYEEDDGSTGTGLFRAVADDPVHPTCWTTDLILSEFDSWRDPNNVEVFLTDLRSTGSSGKPANGAIGSNSLVGGLLPNVDPAAIAADPTSPLSSGGVLFNGATLIDENPAQNNLTEVACNDDNAAGECGVDTSDSALSVPVTAGTTYFIEVTSRTFSGPGGTLDIYLECDDGLGSLGTSGDDLAAADECTGATIVPTGNVAFAPSTQDTTVATLAESDPLQSCTILFDGISTGGRRNSHSVWYKYTPDVDCTLTIDTCGSTPDDPDPGDPTDNDQFYNTVVTVYTGSCGPSDTDPLINDGLKAKGRFATVSGFTLTVQDAAELANVVVRDSVEVVSGAGLAASEQGEFHEIIAIAGATLTLASDAGNSTGDVVWQVNDNEFFNQLLYLKPFEALPDIPPGSDCWKTLTCTEGGTEVAFNTTEMPAIPADFFFPGSEPFTGTIELEGASPDPLTPDTFMQRLSGMSFAETLPDTASTPIQLVQLDLVGCSPITVNPGGTQWDVAVSLSATPVPDGLMTVTKEHANGGTFDAQFFVQPVFTFTEVGNPGNVLVLDTGIEGIPPMDLSTSGASWVHTLEPGHPAVPCGENFVPGIEDPFPFGRGGGPQRCVPTCHDNRDGTHPHCVRPPGCPIACPFTCGDINGDGSNNLADFVLFAGCFGGDPTLSQDCTCSDMNGDAAVNLADFVLFAGIFGGSTTYQPPTCP